MRRFALAFLVAAAVTAAGGAVAADSFELRLVSQTSSTITLGWDPQPGFGYLFSADGQLVSRTNDPSRSTVKFSKSYSTYEVAVIVKGATGTYPIAAPPSSPPTATFAVSPSPAVVGQPVTFDWNGTCPAGGCSFVWEDEGPDGPGGTDYAWGTGDPFVMSFSSVGTKYVHLVVTDAAGATAESRQQLTVAASPPPVAQCADGIDNDGDGKADFADPGCSGTDDDDETDVPVPPTAQCADTVDNDADGKVDYPNDPGCSGANDDDETDPAPPASASVYVDPAGNDANGCTVAAPCRSLTRAYAVAASGATISVAGGTYATSEAQNTLVGSKQVTFRVASGVASFTSDVLFDDLSNVTFYGPLNTKPAYTPSTDLDDDFGITGCSHDITVYDVRATQFGIGGYAFHQGAPDNITIKGADFGGYTTRDAEDSWIGGGGGSICGDGISSNIILDGVYVHDALFVPSSEWGDAHPDCLQTGGSVDNLVIRNSRFERCGNSFLGFYGDFGNMANVLIENNVFAKIGDSYWGFNIDQKNKQCSMTIRYNTYDPDNPGSAGYAYSPALIVCDQLQVYGNIFRRSPPGGCGASSSSYSYNVYELGNDPAFGGTCGTNAVSGNAGYVARGTDYHLAPGALAIGKGDPSRFPPSDFEGTVRTSPPDAGYDER